MKNSMIVFLAVLSFNSFGAPIDKSIDNKINRLQMASESGEILRLSISDKEELNKSLLRSVSLLGAPDNRPLPPTDRIPTPPTGDWRRNTSFERNKVISYSDDRCTVAVTEVTPRDNCNRLSSVFGSKNVWSVSINGECNDIADTTFQRSCDSMVELASTQKARSEDLVTYKDDRCTVKGATIDPGVDCRSLGNVLSTQNVWSVRFMGQCVDIPDTSFNEQKCAEYQDAVLSTYENDGSRRRGDTVELFSDDRCTVAVTTIKRGDNCNALENVFRGKNVWSVKFRGQCVDIPDTTFSPACNGYAQ